MTTIDHLIHKHLLETDLVPLTDDELKSLLLARWSIGGKTGQIDRERSIREIARRNA